MLEKLVKFKKIIKMCKYKIEGLQKSVYLRAAWKLVVFSIALIFIIGNYNSFNKITAQTADYKETFVKNSQNSVYSYEYDFTAIDSNFQKMEISVMGVVDTSTLKFVMKNADGENVIDKYTYSKEVEDQSTLLTISADAPLQTNQEYQIYVQSPDQMSAEAMEWTVYTYSFEITVYLFCVLLLMVPVTIWCLRGMKKKAAADRKAGISLAVCLIAAITAHIMMELVYNPDALQISFFTAMGNVICYFGIYCLLLLLLNSQRWAVIAGSVGIYIFSLANGFVYAFRGQPVQPIDITSASTALEVAGRYKYVITEQIVIASVLLLSVCFMMLISDDHKLALSKKAKAAVRLCGIAFGCVFFGTVTSDTYMQEFKVGVWQSSPMVSYKQNGFAMSFIAFGKEMIVDKPEGYTTATVREMENTYSNSNSETSADTKQKPNVIVVMNETFTDLSFVNEFETTQPYMPFFDSLTENTIKGSMLVSVLGGTTCNSEYEFLTGNSIELFKVMSVPYSTSIDTKNYSLAWTLKEQGYDTTAFHPYSSKNWRREKVYPLLGFDEFLSEDDVDDPELVREFISDKSDYDKIIDLVQNKESDKPSFIFNVTIQNHGSYPAGGVEVTTTPTEKTDYSDVNQYLSLIKESDSALEYLIDSFKDYEEPTIIVFFGDHFPTLDSEFMDWLYGKSEDDLTLEEIQRKYTVPFMIWANYDIEEQENIFTSANYLSSMLLETAGLQMTPYNQYLLNLQQEIPALNVNGYLGSDGNYHFYSEETADTDSIVTYDVLQYNELLDKRHRVDSFFEIADE
ncbi:MAG: LTA synthase family protein [Lachnospiraceae bacterium]|nr:LTA synthase family protein [Lachnospiraceae bacterium]MDD3615920.1 LTA synthase family protein [Lachnospiraceae bacterium]